MLRELTFKTEPFEHQIQAVGRFIDEHYGAFFCEMGTGKTKMILDIMLNGKLPGALIAAPNGLHRNWYRSEIPTHCHEDQLNVYCWQGRIASEKEHKKWFRFLKSCEIDENLFHIFLINVEALRTDAGFKAAQEFQSAIGYDGHFVIDESTCIKNPKAQVTKACLKLAQGSKSRWILNGTPITQGPLDLYSQCKFLDRDAIPFTTFTVFKNAFAVEERVTMQNRTFNKLVAYKNLKHLTNLLEPFSLRLEKKDCLDLPEKVFVEHAVEMTPEQRRVYEPLKNLCLAQLDSGEIMTADIALVQLLRLHQITTGFFKDDEGTTHPLKNNRINALLAIAETTRPLVIFCAYRENVVQVTDALVRAFPDKNVATFTGDTKGEDRTSAVQRFQDGEVNFFIGTSAAAKGLTLHRASTMVYFSNNYSLETRLQSQDRIHRIGQTNHCTYIDLVSEDTVDTTILAALKAKKEIAKTVLDDLREYIQYEN